MLVMVGPIDHSFSSTSMTVALVSPEPASPLDAELSSRNPKSATHSAAIATANAPRPMMERSSLLICSHHEDPVPDRSGK